MTRSGRSLKAGLGEDRVLFVSNYSPLVATSGAAIRGQQMLRFLGSRYWVDVVFESGKEVQTGGQSLQVDLGAVATVPPVSPLWRLLAPLSTLPHHHATMNQRGFASTIRRLAGDQGYAFVWMNKSWLYPAIREALPDVPVFIEQQAAERDVWENLAQKDPRWYVRRYSRWNGRNVLAYERGIYAGLAGAVSISTADAEITRETYPQIPLIAVPVGVDCAYYRPTNSEPEPHTLLFSGNDATRNVEAVRRFVTRIAPSLRAVDPTFRLLWIGRVDPGRCDFLRGDLVELTGYVEHVPVHFDRGMIFIAPFDMGEGVKVKIVEALAMGKLIVSTRVGVHGLGLEGLPFVHIADDDDGFAKAILDFSREPRRAELSAEARRYAVEHFEREKVTAPLQTFIDDSLATWRTRMVSVG